MPFAIIILALVLIVAGFKGTVGSLFGLVEQTFAQIVVPFVAILIIGAMGYIPQMKRLSDAFLALVLLAMFLSNSKNGLISKFQNAIRNPQTPSPNASGNVSLGTAQWSQAGSIVGNQLGTELAGSNDNAQTENSLDIAPLSGLDTLQPIQSLVG